MRSYLFVTLVALISAVTPQTLTASAEADPTAILHRFVDARNKADESAALALVADDLIYVDGSACPPTNPCIGWQAVIADLRTLWADHAQSALIETPHISGRTVTVRAEMSDDAIRAAGLERVVYEYTVEVQEGKLTRFSAVQDSSDPQTAAFEALQRASLDISPPTRDDWWLGSVAAASLAPVSPPTRDDWPFRTGP